MAWFTAKRNAVEDKRLNSHVKTLTLINVPLTSGLLARFPRSFPADRTSSDSVSSPEVNEGLGTTGSGKVSSFLASVSQFISLN